MDASLTVATAATVKELIRKADLKTQLGITVSTYDTELDAIIDRVSAAIVSYCDLATDQLGRATFARESMVATFYAGACRDQHLLLPWRIPVGTITSVVEAGLTLAATDYRVLPMRAILERLDDDYPVAWSSEKIVVTYAAGWVMPATLPYDIQQAALYEASARWYAKDRDPLLRSETIPDVFQQSWASSGGALDMSAGVLPETAGMLAKYRHIPT